MARHIEHHHSVCMPGHVYDEELSQQGCPTIRATARELKTQGIKPKFQTERSLWWANERMLGEWKYESIATCPSKKFVGEGLVLESCYSRVM